MATHISKTVHVNEDELLSLKQQLNGLQEKLSSLLGQSQAFQNQDISQPHGQIENIKQKYKDELLPKDDDKQIIHHDDEEPEDWDNTREPSLEKKLEQLDAEIFSIRQQLKLSENNVTEEKKARQQAEKNVQTLIKENRLLQIQIDKFQNIESTLASIRPLQTVFTIAPPSEAMDLPEKDFMDWLREYERILNLATDLTPYLYETVVFFPDDAIKRKTRFLTSVVNSAKKSIKICSYRLSLRDITIILRAKSKNDSDFVQIIVDYAVANDPASRGSELALLLKYGIEIRMWGTANKLMHFKFILIDDRILLVGSFNWTYGASKNNMENVIVTTSKYQVEAHVKKFQELYKESQPLDLPHGNINEASFTHKIKKV